VKRGRVTEAYLLKGIIGVTILCHVTLSHGSMALSFSLVIVEGLVKEK
jgi:hypothetical protein